MATLIDSKLIYVLEIIYEDSMDDNESKTVELKLLNPVCMQKINANNGFDTKPVMYSNFMLQPTNEGLFYQINFLPHFSSFKQVLKYSIPSEYIIKNQKDYFTIKMSDYNLLAKSNVLSCVTNGEYIVSTTNQNLIVIWHK